MSIHLTQAVYALDQSLTTGYQQAVLVALASCANEKNGYACYPSRSTLARMTHFSEKTVQRSLAALCKSGLIKVTTRYEPKKGHMSNSYEFLKPIWDRVTQTHPWGLLDPTPGANGGAPPGSNGPTNKNDKHKLNNDFSFKEDLEKARREKMRKFYASNGYPEDYDPNQPDKYPDFTFLPMNWTVV